MSFRLTAPKVVLTEEQLIKRCRKYLATRGYWLHRNPVGKFRTLSGSFVDFGPEGIPDYTAIHRTFPAFFIEFKRPGKLLRESQRSMFEVIQFSFKLPAVMVDSIEALEEWLGGHEARRRSMTEQLPWDGP